jgi:hypothetical protein
MQPVHLNSSTVANGSADLGRKRLPLRSGMEDGERPALRQQIPETKRYADRQYAYSRATAMSTPTRASWWQPISSNQTRTTLRGPPRGVVASVVHPDVRHHPRSRRHPGDPRSPGLRPLRAESRPRPTGARRRRALIGSSRARRPSSSRRREASSVLIQPAHLPVDGGGMPA